MIYTVIRDILFTRYSMINLSKHLLMSGFISFSCFFSTTINSQNLRPLCSGIDPEENCYTYLLSPYNKLKAARENDPFLFCTEGDPEANILVGYKDLPTLTNKDSAIIKNKIAEQPLAYYCVKTEPAYCKGAYAPLASEREHRAKQNVTNKILSRPTKQRSEGTVKVVTLGVTTWYCPCYDTAKLALWNEVCRNRERGNWEEKPNLHDNGRIKSDGRRH
jgi:hypothetical protein